MIPKLDLKQQYRHLYHVPRGKIILVDVPPLPYLMLDGQGDPATSPEYQAAISALFTLAYTLKFMARKAEPPMDYRVMPLEALWWAHDMSAFTDQRRDEWLWTSMILQPECIGQTEVAMAKEALARKNPQPALAKVRLEILREGKAAQLLHIGPFSGEGPAIERLHAHIEQSGGRLAGRHHEIYLSDMRRSPPEKWRTIIRQPMQDSQAAAGPARHG